MGCVMKNKKLRFLNGADLRRAGKPPSYLINRAIPERGIALLVAPPSHKKSFVAMTMACSIASGTDFLGRKTKQGTVLYLAGEGNQALHKRKVAWEKFYETSIAEKNLAISNGHVVLNADDGFQEAIEAIGRYELDYGEISLLVIDTLNRTFEGDENNSTHVTKYVVALSQIIEQFNCAVLLVHHPGHDGKTKTRPRGFSGLKGAVDIQMAIEKGDTDTPTLLMGVKPPKDDEPGPDLHLKTETILLDEELGHDENGHPISSLVIVENDDLPALTPKVRSKTMSKRNLLREHILSMDFAEPIKREAIIDDCLKLGITNVHETIMRAVDARITEGFIIRTNYGHYDIVRT